MSKIDTANERAYVAHTFLLLTSGLEAFPAVDPGKLASPSCAAILEAIRAISEGGGVVSLMEVSDRLSSIGKRVPDEDLLTITGGDISDGVSLATRAARIEKAAELRRLDSAGRRLQGAVADGDLDGAREAAAEMLDSGDGNQPFTVRTAYESAYSAMEMLVDGMEKVQTRVRFEDQELAEGVGTLGPGTLTVIGAGTGVGKSTLALYLSRCIRPAMGIVSLEDPPEVYGARILSPLAGVSSSVIFTGQIGNADTMRDLDAGLRRVSKLPMLAYAIGAPIVDVLAAIRCLAVKHGCKLIAVDYVQAIRVDSRVDRRIAIADAVAQMKACAAKLGVALVVCSQLSRPPSDVKFREPQTHHLKETGDLENMAEAIVLLWKTSDHPTANVYGKVAKLKWGYGGRRFRFERDHLGNLISCAQWDGVDLDNAQPVRQQNGKPDWRD